MDYKKEITFQTEKDQQEGEEDLDDITIGVNLRFIREIDFLQQSSTAEGGEGQRGNAAIPNCFKMNIFRMPEEEASNNMRCLQLTYVDD